MNKNREFCGIFNNKDKEVMLMVEDALMLYIMTSVKEENKKKKRKFLAFSR